MFLKSQILLFQAQLCGIWKSTALIKTQGCARVLLKLLHRTSPATSPFTVTRQDVGCELAPSQSLKQVGERMLGWHQPSTLLPLSRVSPLLLVVVLPGDCPHLPSPHPHIHCWLTEFACLGPTGILCTVVLFTEINGAQWGCGQQRKWLSDACFCNTS